MLHTDIPCIRMGMSQGGYINGIPDNHAVRTGGPGPWAFRVLLPSSAVALSPLGTVQKHAKSCADPRDRLSVAYYSLYQMRW